MIKLTETHPDFNRFKFVSKALSKDKARPALNCFLIEDNTIIATDGYRMHVAITYASYEPGLYEIVTNKQTAFIAIKSSMHEGLSFFR